MEIWKDVVGYEGLYEVSSEGDVRTKAGRKVAQVVTGESGYLYVNLKKPEYRKLVVVHRIVAAAFCEKPEGCNLVDHIDQDKFNNKATNLRWTTDSGNQRNTKNNIKASCGKNAIDKAEEIYGNSHVYKKHLLSRMNSGMTFEEAVFDYEFQKETGKSVHQWKTEIDDVYTFYGERASLLDVSNITGKSIPVIREYLSNGWSLEEIAAGHKFFKGDGIQTQTYWFPNKTEMLKHYKVSGELYAEKSDEGWSIEDIVEYKNNLYKRRVVVDGKEYYETLKTLCEIFNLTEQKVKVRMNRNGLSLEQALSMKQQRIIKHSINGVVKRNSVWCREFGLNPINVSNHCYKYDKTFSEALRKFGVDTSDMVILPCK